MNHIKEVLSLFAVTFLLAACGGGGGGGGGAAPTAQQNPAIISGQVQQGNILGAKVFLDLNGNGIQDSGERETLHATGVDGKFTLSLSGDDAEKLKAHLGTAKLVSVGGTDTTTGLAAGLLVAEAPEILDDNATRNITPMTTLVAMTEDTHKGNLKTVLSSLGLKDDGLIDGSTPAVIATAKSVETALLSLQQSVASKSSDDVAKAVARAAAAEIGKALSTKSSAELTDTAMLANVISGAVGTAFSQVSGTQLTVHVADLTTWIREASWEAAEAVKSKTGGTLSTSGSNSEAEIMDDTVKGRITGAVDTCTGKLKGEITTPAFKIATVTFSASSAAPLPVPLQGVMLSAIMPANAMVDTNPLTSTINAESLIAAGPSMQITGSFATDTRKVQVTVVMSTETFSGGNLASLKVNFPSTAVPTAGDFTAPTLIQAVGYNALTHSSVDLTASVQTALGVTFN